MQMAERLLVQISSNRDFCLSHSCFICNIINTVSNAWQDVSVVLSATPENNRMKGNNVRIQRFLRSMSTGGKKKIQRDCWKISEFSYRKLKMSMKTAGERKCQNIVCLRDVIKASVRPTSTCIHGLLRTVIQEQRELVVFRKFIVSIFWVYCYLVEGHQVGHQRSSSKQESHRDIL